MSWWQRVIQWFHKDKRNDIRVKEDKPFTYDVADDNRNSPSQRYPKIEGRVLYQYPKGKFRFPIIPDQEGNGHNNGENEQNRTVIKNKSKSKKQVREEQDSPQTQTSTAKNKNKGPFQPTILPPPLYGLKKNQLQEPIEYELTQSLHQKDQVETTKGGIIQAVPEESYDSRISSDSDSSPHQSQSFYHAENNESVHKQYLEEMVEQEIAVAIENVNTYENENASVSSKEAEKEVMSELGVKTRMLSVLGIPEGTGLFGVQQPSETLEWETESEVDQPSERSERKVEAEGTPPSETAEWKAELENSQPSETPEWETESEVDQPSEIPERKVEAEGTPPSETAEWKAELENSQPSETPEWETEPEVDQPSEIPERKDEQEGNQPSAPLQKDTQEIAQQPSDMLNQTEKQSRISERDDTSSSIEKNKKQRHQQPRIPFNVIMLSSDKRKLAKRNLRSPQKVQESVSRREEERVDGGKSKNARTLLKEETSEQNKITEDGQPSTHTLRTNGGETQSIRSHSYSVQNQNKESSEDQLVRNGVWSEEKTVDALTKGNDREEVYADSAIDNKLERSVLGSNATISNELSGKGYLFPALSLLHPPVINDEDEDWLAEQRQLLNETLKNFHVQAKVVNVTKGPAVTRFEVQPELGVKVNKITNLSDDIKLSLAARDIRMEAPIPGKHTIGIEVPNKSSRPVLISEIIGNDAFNKQSSPLSVALGLDISGQPVITDLKKMPHGLIAGATGSGKSVCINTVIVSLLYKAHPEEVKLLLIDPKMVELAPYNRIPHLISPVITDVKAATASLKWAVEEMERRYQLFAAAGARDISRYNEMVRKHHGAEKLPYIVIIIDELADLMMMSPADVEEAICRIAQKARACGIHLLIATQRPSVDVITGLIKANVPTRIAFSVSSQVDSRTIIDISGAERLLGRGDMLFLENGASKPIRLQGTFVSDDEIDEVVAFVRKQQEPSYLFEQEELLQQTQLNEAEDELFEEACAFIVQQGTASTSSLQRRFRIGYNRAARLIDMMEQQGFISEARGSKPREVFMTEYDLENI